MAKPDREKEQLRLALTKAAAVLAAVAACIRAKDGSIAIECADIHSIAFCGERDARTALKSEV